MSNQVTNQPTRFYFAPPYATRIIIHDAGRVEIECRQGDEADVIEYLRNQLDIFEAQCDLQKPPHRQPDAPKTKFIGGSRAQIVPPPQGQPQVDSSENDTASTIAARNGAQG